MRLFLRIINLLLFPTKEWSEIAAKNDARKATFLRIVAPLLGLMAVATVFGTWLYTSREIYSLKYVMYRVVVLWTATIVGLYVSAFVATEIMTQKAGVKDHAKGFALMANAAIAAYLALMIVALFPFFKEFLVLSFYSIYLYWLGIPAMMQIDKEKQTAFAALALVITAVVHLFVYFLFGNIFKALLL